MSLLLPLYEPLPGRSLFVIPHADDEVLGCGAALLAHAAQGDPVDVLCVFDGALGNEEGVVDPALVARREGELLASLQVLAPDVETTVHHWCLPEGHDPTSAQLLSASQRLAGLLQRLRPATLYAPWPGDEHPDHRSVSAAVAGALAAVEDGAPLRAIAYEVWSDLDPDWVLPLGSRAWATLESALACHGSQGGESELRIQMRERAYHRSALGGSFGQVYSLFPRAPRRSAAA